MEDQLTELKEQLGRGVITQEEYEQKKKKLLENLRGNYVTVASLKFCKIGLCANFDRANVENILTS